MTQRQIAPSPKKRPKTAAPAEPEPTLDPVDPRTFGLAKAAYSVRETLDLLSIGRTSLYEAV